MPAQLSAELAVFISHSTTDELLANSIAGLLQSALPLAPGQIRCSKVEGHRFQWGSQLDSAILKKLNDAPVFIVLVTDSSTTGIGLFRSRAATVLRWNPPQLSRQNTQPQIPQR